MLFLVRNFIGFLFCYNFRKNYGLIYEEVFGREDSVFKDWWNNDIIKVICFVKLIVKENFWYVMWCMWGNFLINYLLFYVIGL